MPSVAALVERVAARRAEVVAAGDQARAALRAAAEAEGGRIRAAADGEAARILAVTEESIVAAVQAAGGAEAAVRAARVREIGRIDAEAEATLSALDGALRESQAAALGAAERHAAAAVAGGEREAQRAVTGARERAGQAVAVGQGRAATLEPTKRGARKARAAREISQETAGEIVKAGAATAGTARTDMAALAGKFRGEGAAVAEQMAGADLASARQRVIDRRAAAVSAVDRAAEQALAQVASDRDAVVEQLGAMRAAAGDVARAAAAAATAIDQGLQAGLAGVDAAVAEIAGGLDEVAAVADALTGRSVADLTAAGAELDAAAGEVLGELDRLVQGSASGMGFAAGTVADDMRQQADLLTAPAAQAATDFNQRTGDAARATVDGITGQADETLAEYSTIRTGVTGTFARALADADRKWAEQETGGLAEVARRVGEGIAAQQKMLDEVGRRIDERAAEIENESWWDRAVGFVAGFVVGFLATAWEMIKVLGVIALVALAVVVVAVIIGALVAGLAGIVAVFAALAAVASFVAAISGVLLAIGVVVVACMAGYKLYKAFSDDTLSAYEKGKLVGGATFDVASLVLGAKFVSWAGRLFGLGVAAEAGAEAAALARLRAVIADEAVLERLLAAAGGDTVKLERMLAGVGGDAGGLDDLVRATGGDAALLDEAVANTAKVRAQTVEALGDAKPATPIGEIGPDQPLGQAMALFDSTNPQMAKDLRVAYEALTDAETVADTVARVQARAIDLAARGVGKPFEVALRSVTDGRIVTLHLDLGDKAEAFLAAVLDLSKKAPDEVINLLPGQLELTEPAFFADVVTKGESFLDISAIVKTAPEHGAATHLLQDLVVDRALARSGSQLTGRALRQALAPAAGEKDIPRAFAWDHIWDAFGDVVNNPNFLNARLGQIFGDLDAVLVHIDEAWAAKFGKLLGKKVKPE
ncbi:hypothetical protein [Paractinoplanes ferrugineus]|uniref:hypothetical protein n=1 Tax=Paractinoplanes ferrugineus TaxID=113564 RepID=UPI0019459ABC|nr:hypothetical protein [Actinoplanes ferrugineus]